MTLLNGSVLDSTSSSPLQICLSKRRGEEYFSNLEVGDLKTLAMHYEVVKELISSELDSQIQEFLPKLNSDPSSEVQSLDEVIVPESLPKFKADHTVPNAES